MVSKSAALQLNLIVKQDCNSAIKVISFSTNETSTLDILRNMSVFFCTGL